MSKKRRRNFRNRQRNSLSQSTRLLSSSSFKTSQIKDQSYNYVIQKNQAFHSQTYKGRKVVKPYRKYENRYKQRPIKIGIAQNRNNETSLKRFIVCSRRHLRRLSLFRTGGIGKGKRVSVKRLITKNSSIKC